VTEAAAVELRTLAVAIAHEGANLAREMQLGGIDVADTKTSAVDVVTEADRAVEALIRSRITAARPDDAILGEEGDDRPGTSGVRWVVDPIDGTVNYLYGLPDCAVSVAVELDGEVVAGAVVAIPTGLEYAAARGAGATRDGQPIGVRPSPPLAERLVLTGFGYQREVRAHQAACVARLLPEVRDIRRMGSCALDLCHVAEGSADAYVEAGPQPWDYSAAGLVLREAGGRFDLLDGSRTFDPYPTRNVVVGAPAEGWDTFVAALGAAGFLS
jgi:myo-inositol-1(or 4)-monophosphatase